MRTYWTIAHGDPDVTGVIFWCGYSSALKEHVFDRNQEKAIKFLDEGSARSAGVGLTKGVKFIEYTLQHGWIRELR